MAWLPRSGGRLPAGCVRWVCKADALGGTTGHLGCRWQSQPPHLPGWVGSVRSAQPGTAWLPSCLPACSPCRLPPSPASQERCKDDAWQRLSLALCLPLALLRQPLMSLPSGPALLFAPKPALLGKSHCSLPKHKCSAEGIALPLLCDVFSSYSQAVAFSSCFPPCGWEVTR